MDFLWNNQLWDQFGQRLFGYSFVHYSFTQAIFAIVILLALGKMVAQIFHWGAVALVFFGGATAGALAFWALVPDDRFGLVGGYPGVYGLIGAFSYILWMQLNGTGHNRYRAFQLIGMLLGIQLLFGTLFGGGYEWIADFAGFAFGFLISFVVSPGGVNRLRQSLRQR